MASSEKWFRVSARQGGDLIAEVLVVGWRDAKADERRLRAQYPTATVTTTRDA